MLEQAYRATHINFIYVTVREGSDTSAIVPSIGGEYDLIMVGRCHENETKVLPGLSERIHSRELGPLGGMLASENIFSLVSVKVVQQQIKKARHTSTFN